MSEPRVKHEMWSMQLTCLMQCLMYGRRGFIDGCWVIVLSQGSVTRCLAMGSSAHERRHLMVNLSRSCESHEYHENGRRLTGIRRDPGPHGCALRGKMCVSLSPRRAAHSSGETRY
ncbi:hypothetical protein L3X38_042973 [Prunus dulcis]|uniref:Uncharacterized protein n=1 Tax=Prunus dulcis TaxID=3755 RepID=A0AAD4UXJ3_PRUDU|nr:hypothetical protein L3X38_042973 [Prunus dulcis]